MLIKLPGQKRPIKAPPLKVIVDRRRRRAPILGLLGLLAGAAVAGWAYKDTLRAQLTREDVPRAPDPADVYVAPTVTEPLG